MPENPPRVVLDQPPQPVRDPILTNVGAQNWRFSFQYWEQRDYFGLAEVETKWFVSLLERLKLLSNKQVNKFVADGQAKKQWRYHPIDWNQKNIPIQRKDLDWLPEEYLDNPDEFPILQFQVSQALGRVVGFWNEESTFNIILLDPLHNIQPSRAHNYKVDATSPLNCEYTTLLSTVNDISQTANCTHEGCEFRYRLSNIQAERPYANIVMHYLDDIALADLDNVLDGDTPPTFAQIFEAGVISLTK